ncbi:hypothetical protein N8508_00235 [bacterium]|nr:hypothetical protein [bacterium]
MKTVLITTIIVEIFQVLMLFSILIGEAMELSRGEEKYLNTKRRVLQFLVPYFWFIPMVLMIIKWWKNLK